MIQNVKILLIGLGMCLLSFGVIYFFQLYIFFNLIMERDSLPSGYLITSLNVLDLAGILLCPLIIAFVHLIFNLKKISLLIKNVLLILVSISISLLLGVVIALFSWKKGVTNSLIPDYYKVQPYEYYWTMFVVFGILLSVIIMYSFRNSKFFQQKAHFEKRQRDDILDSFEKLNSPK